MRRESFFWGRWSVVVVHRVLLVLSAWLQKKSNAKWQDVVFAVDKSKGCDEERLLESPYKPFKTTHPETLYHKGSTGGSTGQIVSALCHSDSALSLAGETFVLPTWSKEIQPFLLNQLSDHTRRAYETDLKHFFLFLEGKIDANRLSQLRPEHIILYRKFLEEGRLTGRPLEKSTINRKLAVVKSFLNWLRANQILKENPAQLVKGFPQNQESSLKGLSDEEVRKILAIPNRNTRSGALHYAVLNCLLYLGLRKGELLDLRMGDLGEERGVSVIKVRGKGHRVRILPLSRAVKAALEHYFYVCRRDQLKTEEPLFLPTKNPRTQELLKPMNPNAITYIVIRYARKAGVLKQISPHSCRATCISNALDRKATQRSVQHLAGWSTPLMIQRYDKRREDLKNSAAFLIDYGETPMETASG